jgi:hypothetical protein
MKNSSWFHRARREIDRRLARALRRRGTASGLPAAGRRFAYAGWALFVLACLTPALAGKPTWGWELLRISFQLLWALITSAPWTWTLTGLDLASLGLVNVLMLASPYVLSKSANRPSRLKWLLAGLVLCDIQAARWIGAEGATFGCYAWICSFFSLTVGAFLAVRACRPAAKTEEDAHERPRPTRTREEAEAARELNRYLSGD